MPNPFTHKRRDRLRSRPFPAEWLAILDRNVPLYRALSPEQQERVRGDMQVLLAEKHFEGCGGLRLDEEIRVTIAAHGALLMLGGEPHYFPDLTSILVYPSARLLPSRERTGAIETEGKIPISGAAARDVVVVSWDDAKTGARVAHDGMNVILHELALQLDFEDGRADGTPYLQGRSQYAAWARAMKPAYEWLRAHPDGDVIRAYAATNPAEFFAVVTEIFFERPDELLERHPDVYAALSRYYGLDLATRHSRRTTPDGGSRTPPAP